MTFYESFQKIKKTVFSLSRAIRIKFLLASVIAVTNGIAISYWKTSYVDFGYALLTFFGILCLHISVDLLNDYSDLRGELIPIQKEQNIVVEQALFPKI